MKIMIYDIMLHENNNILYTEPCLLYIIRYWKRIRMTISGFQALKEMPFGNKETL